MVRSSVLALCASVLIAADYPDPPPVLAPHFDDGKFVPGSFGWMRGKFPEATEAEKTATAQVEDWVKKCFEEGGESAVEALAERGVSVADPWRLGSVPLICALVSTRPANLSAFKSFDRFQEVLGRTKPIVAAFLFAAESAEATVAEEEGLLADQLRECVVRDQVLRKAMAWVSRPDSALPQLSEAQKPIFMALLGQEVTRVDTANTLWLKQTVEQNGWPTVSTVGEKGSARAWLLVQHADHDPVFQFDVLRLMEPLVAQKEVSPADYAYLYDRVMLKLTGKQRYATQMWCQNGRMEPQPVEDEKKVEALRAEMQLEPLADYRKLFPDSC